MAHWGRNDQAPTANSTTVKETSNGAPMGLSAYVKGGKTGLAANSSHSTNSTFGNTSAGSVAAIDVGLFNNTTPSAFVFGQCVGTYGVSATEMSNNTLNHAADQPQHAGC